MSGKPKMLVILGKISGFKCHSVLSLKCLENWSASTLSFPGKWRTVSQILFSIHCHQREFCEGVAINKFSASHCIDITYVVVLSLLMQTCFPFKSKIKDFSPKRTAKISSSLMCRSLSREDHPPWADCPLYTAPPPTQFLRHQWSFRHLGYLSIRFCRQWVNSVSITVNQFWIPVIMSYVPQSNFYLPLKPRSYLL